MRKLARRPVTFTLAADVLAAVDKKAAETELPRGTIIDLAIRRAMLLPDPVDGRVPSPPEQKSA